MIHKTKVLDGVTANTTASTIPEVEDAVQLMIVINRADHSSGSSAFSAEVSIDGTNYVAYDRWIDNVAATNSQTVTRVTSKSLGGNGTDCMVMSPEDVGLFKHIKVKVVETTDGTHSAWVVWKTV